MGRFAFLFAVLASLLVSACGGASRDGPPADPALYIVTNANAPAGSAEPAGWLFGTIHALPTGTRWRTPEIDRAVADADVLVVEAADLDETLAIARSFIELARTDGLPPLSERVDRADRGALTQLLEKADLKPGQFRNVETWAAALTIGAKIAAKSGLDSDESIDLALMDDFDGREIVGLETARGQLSIFDRLAPTDQQALLEGMLEDGATDDPGKELSEAWMRGDIDTMLAITDDGMEGAPGLRSALLSGRNRAWATKIVPLLENGKRPLIAVGAGHIGGSDGLVELLKAQGFRVTRAE